MADDIAPLSGRDAFEYLSRLLALDVAVEGTENIPASGGFILAPSHPTGIGDGIAIYDALKGVRPDMAIFANRDALRVAARFSRSSSRSNGARARRPTPRAGTTLEMTARAFSAGKAIVLFPSGRIAYWNEGKLTERPWQPSVVALARRYRVPIVPTRITARNSGLFYFLSKYSTELRDMTVFHEFLNKKGCPFSITFGKPVPADRLEGDPAEVTAELQEHTLFGLAGDRNRIFRADA